jgi:phosphoribosylaminoimidazole carboxylase PurE protein
VADVIILTGSASDKPVFESLFELFDSNGISYHFEVASAHRNPERVAEITGNARESGCKVMIAGAGMAAHLAGAVASKTTLPVIGVPCDGGPLNGFDALLSTVQMPRGVPVATVAIGKSGAYNAGILAMQIMSLTDKDIESKLIQLRGEWNK